MEVNEMKVPAPWGEIAVKTWGLNVNEAVIVAHGFKDNAGSFDNLIPLLSKNFYYLCIDLPGHGLSMGFHNSTPIITVDYVLVFKIIANFFGRQKYTLIGHSYGGHILILFSQMYPESVSRLILLDALSYDPFSPDNFLHRVKMAIEYTVTKQTKDRTIFSYEEAVSKLMGARMLGELTRQASENLVNRNFENIGSDRYVIRLDPRLKQPQNPNGDLDYILQMHYKSPIKCKVLLILFKQSKFDSGVLYKYFQEQDFEIHHVDGHHNSHSTNPETIVPIINEFLTRNNKL